MVDIKHLQDRTENVSINYMYVISTMTDMTHRQKQLINPAIAYMANHTTNVHTAGSYSTELTGMFITYMYLVVFQIPALDLLILPS